MWSFKQPLRRLWSFLAGDRPVNDAEPTRQPLGPAQRRDAAGPRLRQLLEERLLLSPIALLASPFTRWLGRLSEACLGRPVPARSPALAKRWKCPWLLAEELEPRWMLTAAAAPSATIVPNQADYVAGQTAVFTGGGFTPDETVTLQVVHSDTNALVNGTSPWTVNADGTGSFQTTWLAPSSDSGSFLVTATGVANDSASASFTEDSPASSYGTLPLAFEPNVGQTSSQVQFLCAPTATRCF